MNTEFSLKAQKTTLKLFCFGHVMLRLEKTSKARKGGRKKKRTTSIKVERHS